MNWNKGKKLKNGNYVIEKILGQGGFGITYKAKHTILDGYVVIKTPLSHQKNMPNYREYVERFKKEGQILEKLSQNSNPHIVKVKDLFIEEKTPCLVMEFIEGRDLYELVNRKSVLAEDEIIPYFRQIADALNIIHSAGLVHRDVHPGNIMLRDDGRAVLIDFGITKELIPSSQTLDGRAGHHVFAPYEQVIHGTWDQTADIYSITATIYYSITGQYPASSYDRKFNKARLIPPKELNPKISDRLNRAILKGMELEVKKRPQSIQEWLRLLEKPNAVVGEQLQSSLARWGSALWQSLSKVSESNEEQQVLYVPQSTRSFYAEPTLRQNEVIPWSWLILPLTGYIAMGFISSQLIDLQGLATSLLMSVFAWLSSLSWAVSGILANIRVNNGEWSISSRWVRAWVRAWNRTLFNFLESIRDSTLLLTWFVTGILVSRSILIWTRYQYWTMVLTGVVFIAASIIDMKKYRLGIYTGGRLLQSFGKLGTFLILVGASAVSLILGWLIGLVL